MADVQQPFITPTFPLVDPESGVASAAFTKFLLALWTRTGGSAGGAQWPVGSIFTAVVSTDPALLLGFGTWQAFGTGRVLAGINNADANFHPVLHTGGSATVTPAGSVSATFTGASDTTSAVSAGTPAGAVAVTIAPYTPTGNVTSAAGAAPGGNTTGLAFVGDSATLTGNATFTGSALGTHTHTVTPTGAVAATFAGASETNLQPYIVVYMWRRIA